MAYRKRQAPAMISKEEMMARVVDPIIAAMAEGKLLWLRPWSVGGGGGLPLNPLRGKDKPKDYTGGVNNLLLMISAMTHGWSDPRWMGRGQIKKGGYSVKGLTNAKSTLIYIPVFGWYDGEDDNGNKVRKKYVKGFREGRVFNAEQIDDESFPALAGREIHDIDVVSGFEVARMIYKAVDVPVTHGGDKAAYSPSRDEIMMPPASAFKSAAAYHATRLHETGHATGHKDRMDRDKFSHFGSALYAEEELIAELFAAFACSYAGVPKEEVTPAHAAYLQSWMRRLKDDPKVFIDSVTAAWAALMWVRERMP